MPPLKAMKNGIGRRAFIGAGAATLLAGASGGAVRGARGVRGDGEVKFCAFADIHYYPGVFPHDTREWLERVLNRAEKSKVDFIIHMGDFTHTPAAAESAESLKKSRLSIFAFILHSFLMELYFP